LRRLAQRKETIAGLEFDHASVFGHRLPRRGIQATSFGLLSGLPS
jgi:hypothetical protein